MEAKSAAFGTKLLNTRLHSVHRTTGVNVRKAFTANKCLRLGLPHAGHCARATGGMDTSNWYWLGLYNTAILLDSAHSPQGSLRQPLASTAHRSLRLKRPDRVA